MASKQEIADLFEKHVSRFGYAKTSLDEVARSLRISKKTIYVHFDGKRELYGYVVKRQAEQQKTHLRASVAGQKDYRAKVEMLVGLVISQARAHINATTEDEWMQEFEIAADAFRTANGDLIREFVDGGIEAGEFRRGDAELVEKMVAAMIVEYAVIVNSNPSYDHDEELVERILRFVG